MSVLIATGRLPPRFTGAVPFSLIHPLNTRPKPPSPIIKSGLKPFVATFKSLNVNLRRREEILSSSSDLEVDVLLSALLVDVDRTAAVTG